MSSLTVNVNDQSYTGHPIRPTVKDSNNNTQITAKLGTVNIDLGQLQLVIQIQRMQIKKLVLVH